MSPSYKMINGKIPNHYRGNCCEKVEVIMGEESPFGKDFGALMVRFTRGEIKDGVIGILGLLRMDWEKNMGLMKYVREMLSP